VSIFFLTIPVFAIISAGYLLRAVKVVEESWIHSLNGFTYRIALPALIAGSFWSLSLQQSELWKIAGYSITTTFILALVVVGGCIVFRTSPSKRIAWLMVTTIGNSIYMGTAIGEQFLGRESIPLVAAAATIQFVIGFLIVLGFLSTLPQNPGQNISSMWINFILNPIPLSLLCGITLSLLVPPVGWIAAVQKSLTLIGATASPLSLFVLGSFLYGRFSTHSGKMATLASIVKIIFFPFLAWIAHYITGVSGVSLVISVLVTAVPSAVTGFVIAEQYHVEEEFVATTILISTLGSALTLPLALSFVG
jgi:predicted permease